MEATNTQIDFLERQYYSLDIIEVPEKNQQYPAGGSLQDLTPEELEDHALIEIKYKQHNDYGNLSGM